MFRWPDEDPISRNPWMALGRSVRWHLAHARQVVRTELLASTPQRGRLTTLIRSRPVPLAIALACGLGSAAWAVQSFGVGLGESLARIGAVSAGPNAESGTSTETSPTPAPAQWGDPLPSARKAHPAQETSDMPALPPATARRQAGTVVLASQFFGIAPYEPSPSERGNLLAVLTAKPDAAPVAAPALGSQPDATGVQNAPATPARERGSLRTSTALSAATPSASHLAQFSEWIGLGESLPVSGSASSFGSSERALTMPQAVELGRLQQRRLLELSAANRENGRAVALASDRTAALENPQADAGHKAAQVFLDALQARMNHALAQRHERQLHRVVGQARAARKLHGEASVKLEQTAERALRQARTRLAEAQTAQRRQLERLTPLIGQLPAALSWGPMPELGLPASARQAHALAAASGDASHPRFVSASLLDAYARHETVTRRMDSVHGLLMTHAQIAGTMHSQMLQGRRELQEVVQAYERLHLSRLAVAALALEELHSQLQVAHVTGRLLQPLTAAAAQERAPARLEASR